MDVMSADFIQENVTDYIESKKFIQDISWFGIPFNLKAGANTNTDTNASADIIIDDTPAAVTVTAADATSKPVTTPSPNANNFDRILHLRKALAHPTTIHTVSGAINDDYFGYTAKTQEEKLLWNDVDRIQLLQGIYKHGIADYDAWNQIKAEFLPHRNWISIRLKLSQLFGRQSLGVYGGQRTKHTNTNTNTNTNNGHSKLDIKGNIKVQFENELQIEAEFQKNKELGMQLGKWNEKLQMYVEFNDEMEQVLLRKQQLQEWFRFIKYNENIVFQPPLTAADLTMRTAEDGAKKKQNRKKKKTTTKKKTQTKKNNKRIDSMFAKQSQQQPASNNGDEKMEAEAEAEAGDAKTNTNTNTSINTDGAVVVAAVAAADTTDVLLASAHAHQKQSEAGAEAEVEAECAAEVKNNIDTAVTEADDEDDDVDLIMID